MWFGGPRGGFGWNKEISPFSCCGASAVSNFNYLIEAHFNEDYENWIKNYPWRTALAITTPEQTIANKRLKEIGALQIGRARNDGRLEGNLIIWQITKPNQANQAYLPLNYQPEPAALQRWDVERAFT